MTTPDPTPWLQRWLLGGCAAILGLALGVGVPGQAVGITACGGVLRDGDDLIPADQEAVVTTATDATQLAGAQPLVVLLRTSGGRNLSAELAEAIATCPALLEDPGQVIAVGIAIEDHTVLIQPGAKVASRLYTEDIAKSMSDQIGHLPVEQILAEGYTKINQQLYETRNDQPTNPILSPTAWGALGVLMLLAAGVGAVWVIQNRNVLRAAKAGAEDLRNRGMAMALDLERDQRALEKQTRDLAEWMALSEVEPLSRAKVETNLRAHAVLRAWHGLTNQMGTGEGLNAEAFNRYRDRLQAAYEDLQGAADQMMRTQGNLAHINSVIDGLDTRLAGAPTQCAAAQAAINAAKHNGWNTAPAEVDLALATTYVAWAQAARDRQELLGADEYLRVAESKIATATTTAQNLERTHTELNQQVAASRNRHRELEESLGPAREAMAGLARSFAQRSWESVAGNGSRAQATLATIPERIQTVQAALDREVQDMGAAHTQLGAIMADLDTAEGLIDAIHETLADLQHAAQLLPDAIRAADRAVEMAVQIAQSRENDEGIAQLQHLRDRIHREHQSDHPDLRALIDTAELLTIQADQWVVEKQGDQAVDASIERAARSGVDQARSRCTQAARLILAHRAALPDSFAQVIEELEEQVDAVVAQPDPAKRLDLATQIRHQAMAVEHEARRVMRTQSQVMPHQGAEPRW